MPMMSSLKSLEDELRAEMCKNSLVRIKRGLSRDQTQEVSVPRSLEAKPVKKALFPANPPQHQTRFTSPSLTMLPPTISMVGYTAVRYLGVLRAFPDPAFLNIWKHFLSTPPHKLGAANRKTVSKIKLD